MRPAVAALCRALPRADVFALAANAAPVATRPARGFDDFADQLEAVLDRPRHFVGDRVRRFVWRTDRACASPPGVPTGRSALVLVSTPGPGWHLRRRHDVYARLPWIFGPVFLAEAPWRLRDELHAALPDRADRRRFARAQLRTFLEAPLSVSRMAARARLIAQLDAAAECARITSPTLVLTGEPGLDHVRLIARGVGLRQPIAGARAVVLEGTGHLGVVTKPDVFAAWSRFVDACFPGSGHAAARHETRTRTMLREIPGPAGRLEVLLDEPASGRRVNEQGLVETGGPGGLKAAVVFGHPHPQFGGTMHTKAMYQSAKALARIGCAVLRFNFRGVGRSEGAFGDGIGEQDDFRAALDFMADALSRCAAVGGGHVVRIVGRR